MKGILRKAKASDLDALYSIWSVSFDSLGAAIFFDSFFNYELSHVVECENEVVAMGYLLPVGELIISSGSSIPCAMIYAVATLSEYRSHGFGSAISKELINTARKSGYPAVVLCPANDKLFDFYSNNTEMKEWFYATEYTFKAPSTGHKHSQFKKISATDYMILRERFLTSIAHIKLNLRAIEYQSKLCSILGGGIYQVETSLGMACAVVERQSDDLIHIKELIFSDNMQNSNSHQNQLQNIASDFLLEFPAKECKIRTPAMNETDNISSANVTNKSTGKFAMLALPHDLQKETNNKTTSPWYGLAFD